MPLFRMDGVDKKGEAALHSVKNVSDLVKPTQKQVVLIAYGVMF